MRKKMIHHFQIKTAKNIKKVKISLCFLNFKVKKTCSQKILLRQRNQMNLKILITNFLVIY